MQEEQRCLKVQTTLDNYDHAHSSHHHNFRKGEGTRHNDHVIYHTHDAWLRKTAPVVAPKEGGVPNCSSSSNV